MRNFPKNIIKAKSFIRNYSANEFLKICSSPAEALEGIKDSSRILVGGFGLCGVPEALIDALNTAKIKNLTIISNNAGLDEQGIGKLIKSDKVKRLIGSYIGENHYCERKYLKGELEIELIPMGTLVEKIRCGGAGIPSFYTPTGLRTLVEKGGIPIKYDPLKKRAIIASKRKDVDCFNGKKYILEESITADYALVKAWKADKLGNLIFRKSARNFNVSMCKAASCTIVEVEEIVDVGNLDPESIHVPGIYVKKLVQAKPSKEIEKVLLAGKTISLMSDPVSERILRRGVLEFKNGTYANLGIGLPIHLAPLVPKDMHVMLQSENGVLGVGPYPQDESEVDADLINAGKETITIKTGGSFFSSEESFAMIRGGHIHLTFLGAMQVSKYGDLANWFIPGKMVKGMGGAMDLVSMKSIGKPMKVIVLMKHLTKDGDFKILDECTYPLTGSRVVDMIITDKCVFKVDPQLGLIMTEIAVGVEIEIVKRATKCDFLIDDNLQPMKQIKI